ncbi:hypothetical protein SSX86_011652 [Deinandra increscens subsp. villosa]|uniref:Transposase, Ptta/En/Spm, plant n=1 Tax=Deinandra increscens subsp. villosa TaxID=3103831 RepID=A0AAP0D2P2_9ASTR
MTTGSRGRVRHMGDSSSSRGGGPIRHVPRTVNSSTSKTSFPYTLNSRSGDSRSLNQHHGYAGSTSHGGHMDPLDDEDDDQFASGKVHRAIKIMFTQKHNGVWLTWKEVPKDVVDKAFDIFKTKYRYDPSCHYATREAFENVMKDRYPDIMSYWRTSSRKKARDAGHFIPPKKHNFKVICDYPPKGVDLDRWRKMCEAWDTEKWLQRSQCARKNRMSADSSGAISRHTGGSMGYDEHRIVLKRNLGRDPTFKELFFATHLTKDSKKKFLSGECQSMEELIFCTARSKEAYGAYETDMLKKYGKQHDDSDLWVGKQGGSGTRIFGIGSSDPQFVVTGKSSTIESGPLIAEYERSQKRVQELEARIETMENQLTQVIENERQARDQEQAQFKEMLHQQMIAFMKQFGQAPVWFTWSVLAVLFGFEGHCFSLFYAFIVKLS